MADFERRREKKIQAEIFKDLSYTFSIQELQKQIKQKDHYSKFDKENFGFGLPNFPKSKQETKNNHDPFKEILNNGQRNALELWQDINSMTIEDSCRSIDNSFDDIDRHID